MSALWPAEDAGSDRTQAAVGPAPSLPLEVVTRSAAGAHMVVIGESDEVYAFGSIFGGGMAWVERVDPVTLDVIDRVEDLPTGTPWWPGGFALHENDSIHVVQGQWAHRLSRDLELLASCELPVERPYNSFVTLPNGLLVMKDLVLDGSDVSTLIVLDPVTMEPVAAPLPMAEGSISRLSADGDVVYAIGDHTAYRYRWVGDQLEMDDTWSFRYRTGADQTYGWDPVIAGGHVWFMDNGEHRYAATMTGKGVAEGPVHLVRIAVEDSDDHELVEISGLPSGAVTNPPLYDWQRRIAVAYDSTNGVLAAFDFDGSLTLRWRLDLNTAGHMIWFPDEGVVMAYHHDETGESVVLVDIETGAEKGRVHTQSPMQSVVFPAAAHGVAYYTSFTTLARIS